jgi:peptide-methionine (R)-S-oxide reductase/peptide methionine sulfoxide reductase msrA/msrB
MMKRAILLLCAVGLIGCEQRVSSSIDSSAKAQAAAASGLHAVPKPTPEQLAEYKKRLGAEAYHVLFEAGTEPPFRNAYHDNHADGTYVSAVTGKPLFSSADKFDSGTGWPSFTRPISDDAVIIREDGDGTGRFEVLDASSGGHLGHIFDDGPADKGGKRYCMNSAAMKFVPKE